MRSRYDLMKTGVTKDEKGRYYPDPLTVNLKGFSPSSSMRKITVTQSYTKRPYMITYNEYGISYYDDLLLWINGVSYSRELVVGETLMIPTFQDLDQYYSDNVVNDREE